MAKSTDIDQAFLYVLQEDDDRDKINQKIRDFDLHDWQRLYELVTKNGLFPIFYIRLLSLNLKNIPSEFLSQLKNLYLLNLKRNILLEQETIKTLQHFQRLNIPVVPLNGPVLARYLYNDLALRQTSCDLDLLVEFERLKEVENNLKEIGYHLFTDEPRQPIFFYKLRERRIYMRKKKFKPIITRIKLNPEQAVLSCCGTTSQSSGAPLNYCGWATGVVKGTCNPIVGTTSVTS